MAISAQTRKEIRAGRAALRAHAITAAERAKNPEPEIKPNRSDDGWSPKMHYGHAPIDTSVPLPEAVRAKIDAANHLWRAIYEEPNPFIRACRILRVKAPREFDQLAKLVVDTISSVPINRGDPNGQVTKDTR